MSMEETIQTAIAFVEMEGYRIDQQSKDWCRLLYENKITMEQYIDLVKAKAGVKG